MVVLGGVTRLTGSGLSMVDWRPLLGWLPPLSDAEWQRVFEMYQQSPEFQKSQCAYGRERLQGHLLARVPAPPARAELIGIVFARTFRLVCRVQGVLPSIANWLEVPAHVRALGGFQGLLGWYMVKSGLVDNPARQPVPPDRAPVQLHSLYTGSCSGWRMSLLYPVQESNRRHPWYGRSVAVAGRPDRSSPIISGGFRCRPQSRS